MGKKKWLLHIDKLTRSIEEVATGKSFDTEVYELPKTDLEHITKKKGWHFNWKQEAAIARRQVYKLVIKNDSEIQCLISIEEAGDHLFLPLIETAPHNLGKDKKYLGAPANLTAFACKRSFELGYDGVVAFSAKTKLINHYRNTLGATNITGGRMAIFTGAAQKLVSLYFKDFIAP